VYFYCKSGKMVTVMFVLPNDKCDVTDDGKDMIYLAQDSESDLYHDKDGNYFTYQAVVDGKITTVKVDEDHRFHLQELLRQGWHHHQAGRCVSHL
jgi:hypothetical protein